MNLSNSVYDTLKKLCTTYIPAAITCFIAIAGALKISAETVETIAAVVSALNTFLGICLGISTGTYWADKRIVTTAAKTPENDV